MGIPTPQHDVTHTTHRGQRVTLLGAAREAITDILVNPALPLREDVKRVGGATILLVGDVIFFWWGSAPGDPIVAMLNKVAVVMFFVLGIFVVIAWLRLFLKISYLNS
jgi:hypothetical protein